MNHDFFYWINMASVVAKASSSCCSSQFSPMVSVQEKGSRNKRKFRADSPMGELNKIIPSIQADCPGYEFTAEKFEANLSHGSSTACDLCGVTGISQEHTDGLKLDLGLSTSIASSEVGPSQSSEELEYEESHDADWSDLTESQLEELVLSNLDAIFKTAIKKIVACGYTEEVAMKAVLRSGLCYGSKDTVSNIVDNTLTFLRNGQEIDPSREHCFEDLQQLEKYILAELVCVLREVRPFFSTGDAMWCLLICDMNVSHACAMDGDALGGLPPDGAPNGTSFTSAQPQLKPETKCFELNLPDPCKPITTQSCSNSSHSEALTMTGVANITKPKNSAVFSGLVSEKEGSISTSEPVDKSSNMAGTSHSPVSEEKFIFSKKVHSGSTKREYILRQKSLQSYRTYGSKGSRTGKLSGLGGLILDKKLKSVSDSAVNLKNAALRLSKAMGVDAPQGHFNLSSNPGSSSSEVVNLEMSNAVSSLSESNAPSSLALVNGLPSLPAVNNAHILSPADTELSLSLSTKSSFSAFPANCHTEAHDFAHSAISYDKCLSQWVAHDRKEEMIMKMLSRVRELQNQLQEWTEWANQKVMQAARRLGKDKAELKSLRQEKKEVERLKKEKQTLEENTMKKLSEMENALCKASGQVERANTAVRRLEVENAALRQEMEAAKLHAVESATSCQEVSKREKKTLMKFQSWEKQKTLLQEELVIEKRKVAQVLKDLEQAKQLQEQHEAKWRQEEKVKDELLSQASSIRKEREQIEASAKSKEDMIKSKAETNLQKYKDDVLKLEKEISQLRLKTDSSKIAALKRGINGSYASRVADTKSSPMQKELCTPSAPEMVTGLVDHSQTGGVKRERECVMCLSEEMSVVFLPCAHQVVCTTCNELHEKQGMKECPSCRSPIQRRIPVRYVCS
ncbi:hypothetical protein K2173_022328 [Erythroxylum novogranatense]|uniref:RING-type domain-containing protein n=1 Tax=Erythroxylum novogranatense TaxID=1862640 RepID=A0AAV8TJC8_9ROSI|nr:hypothetical protein K2173_022328 [Erythroxylum novogranatense]